MDSAQPLKDFQPRHDFFVGIDSDGCVFDTMEIKQKECFIPTHVKVWGLQSISKYLRETAEFVNLYSKWRGVNRWPAMVKVFELLEERPEVQARNPAMPEWSKLDAFVKSGRPLTNQTIQELIDETGDPVYVKALEWSHAINKAVDDMVEGVPPFPYVRESLEKMGKQADAIVVSQTPTPALQKEWAEHDIARLVRFIAGQEIGTKGEMLKMAAGGRYPSDKILMIGDAPGDRKAAAAVDALFYPINPGDEELSWQRFYEEALDRFFAGTYKGDYENQLIDEFERHLPSTPPWKK